MKTRFLIVDAKVSGGGLRGRGAVGALALSFAVLAGAPAQAQLVTATRVLEEVKVTAQKREQSLGDVPVAVTVFDAEAIAAWGVDDLLDISQLSPSVSFTPQQNKMSNSPLRIRGVGQSGTNPAFEGSVGVYVDGVYRSRTGMVLGTLHDIEAVEILRGPQGTLFGKNTSAGALTFRSTAPTESFEAGGTLRGGNLGAQRIEAFVSGPVTDGLALRFSALSDQRDGYIESRDTGDEFGNVDTESYKFQALYDAGGSFTLRVVADYNSADETCCYGNAVRITDDLLDPLLYAPLAASVGLSLESPADPFNRYNSVNRLAQDEVEDKGIVADAAWQLGDGTLRSITSWRTWDYDQRGVDLDFGPVDLLEADLLFDIETFSQEFNYAGRMEGLGAVEALDYVLGAYYSNETIDFRRTASEGIHAVPNWVTLYDVILGVANFTDPTAPGFIPPQFLAAPGVDVSDGHFDHDNDVLAFYGHGTWQFSDRWSLVTGLRWSDEEKRVVFTNNLDASVLPFQSLGVYLLGSGTGGRSFDETQSDREWTGNLALQYFTDGGDMVYASYARGFKSGGVSLNVDAGGMVPWAVSPTGFTPALDPTYEPEFVDAWELGWKGQQLGGRSRTTVTAFYQDYTDIQFQVFNGIGFEVYNGSSAESKGIEFENTLQWTDQLRTSVAFTWLDAGFGSEPDTPENLRGRDLDHAPSFAGTLGVFYEQPVGDALTGYGNLAWAYMGEHYTDNATDIEQDAYDLLNLAVGLRGQDARWDVTVWCRNCTDEEYVIAAFNQPFYFGGAQSAYLGEPRTYGVTLSVAFR